jgi:hypothetical protein
MSGEKLTSASQAASKPRYILRQVLFYVYRSDMMRRVGRVYGVDFNDLHGT